MTNHHPEELGYHFNYLDKQLMPSYDARLDPKSTGYDPKYIPVDGNYTAVILTQPPLQPIKDMKYDDGKLLAWLPIEDFPLALEELIKVGTMGAGKYERNSWKTVQNKSIRYRDAFARHLIAVGKGERIDPESGLMHLSHALWNLCAIVQMEREEDNAKQSV